MFNFKFSKIITGILLGVIIAVAVKVFFSFIPFFQNIELLTLDYRFRLLANPAEANKDIVLVMIDQVSLDYLEYERDQREPQFWPWDRFVYANVLDYLRPGQPRAVIFDLTLKRHNDEGDDQFAESIKKSGNVYGPMVFTREKEEAYTKLIPAETKQILFDKLAINLKDSSRLKLPEYNMVIPPNSTLLAAPKRLGAVNINKDPDGVLRKVSLLYKYENKLFPSLPLAAAMDIRKTAGKISLSAGNSITIGEENLHLSSQGEMYIWWHGPPRTYSYIPFRELFDAWYYQAINKPDRIPEAFKPEKFAGKIIFIGTQAPALGDLHSTPLGNVYPGVEAQATILDNLLSGRCLRPAVNTVNWLSILLICVIGGFFMFAIRSFLKESMAVLLLAVLFIIIAFYVFAQYHYWLELAAPLSGIFLTFTSATVIYYFTEGKEKRRIKATFSKYLAPDVVEEILKEYKNLKADIGERKKLTILFSDIRGFTTISESLAPEEVVHLLNEYLTHMVEIIFHHGGTLDKYIGDGIMAFWGAPKEQSDHASQAVLTAQDMVRQTRLLQAKWAQEGKPNLNIGVGINTGEVVVGNIGSERRLDYTAIGDNVNLAARLEPLNKEYGTNIIISEFTAKELGEQFKLRELGSVKVKGKAKSVLIYGVTVD